MNPIIPPSGRGFTHRAVQQQDLAIICTFPQTAQELFFLYPKASFPLNDSQLAEAVSKRFDSTVVLRNQQVIAFANYYQREIGKHCAIGNVMVSPQVRGSGAGKYLLQVMIDRAFQEYHVGEVHISCFNENTVGLVLYPKFGFCPYAIEERLDYQGKRVALIQMRLTYEKYQEIHTKNP